MANYANQKTITFNREKVDQNGKSRQYLLAYTDNIAAAARNLNGTTFKLYLYFITNADKYTKDFSPTHFENIYGVSNSSTKRAFQELEDSGYLVKNERNKYDFYEVPQSKSKISLDSLNIETRYIPQDNGIMQEMTYLEVYNELKDFVPEDEIKRFWNEQKIAV